MRVFVCCIWSVSSSGSGGSPLERKRDDLLCCFPCSSKLTPQYSTEKLPETLQGRQSGRERESA